MFDDWNLEDYNPYDLHPDQQTIYIAPVLPIVLLVVLVSLVWLRRRGKSFGYLLCFSIFAVYLAGFAAATFFPFPIRWGPRGFKAACLHLVPALVEGDDLNFRIDHEQVWGNFLAGVPFGFGLPFVALPASSTWKRMMMVGLGAALAPELIQLLQNILFCDFPSRTVDVDDVWLCFAGTLAGYGVLWAAARLYQRIGWAAGARLPVWDHIHTVLLNVASGGPISRTGQPSPVDHASRSARTE
jgi:glycopeptide antibiotics resistance protein